MAVVSVTAAGDPRYGLSARQTVRSVLDHTDFDIVVHCDAANAALMPISDRVVLDIAEMRFAHRADRFLIKFDAWRAALDRSAAEVIVHLDADAVLCAPMTDEDLTHALGAGQFAMAEQTGIIGSSMDRAAFLEHYLTHSHAFIAPLLPEPTLEEFRFFNSGVIVFRRLELENLLRWAGGLRGDLPAHHAVGEHMIADQDYLQVWGNVIRADARSELDSTWNHCPLWDGDFPRSDARVVHLSNFCNGPPVQTAIALQAHRSMESLAPVTPWSRLAFCLVTHESAATLDACLTALRAFDGAEIVVVDNASTDGTASIIDDHGLVPIRNDANLGFARGANRAAAATSREILCFINPDAFVDHESISDAVERILREPDVALVPDYVHADGRIERGVQFGYTRTKVALDVLRTGRDPRSMEWVERYVDPEDRTWNWPIAACLLIDHRTFDRIGGFDESYFVYMEDVELGRQLQLHGGRVGSTGTTIVHLGAEGSATDRAERDRLLDDARIVFGSHRHGRSFGVLLRAMRWAVATVERVRR